MTARQPQVFISYQRTDELFARQVREHLVAHGVKTWMDQYDIAVGAYWPDEIDKGLAASDIVVGILSPDSVDSRNVKNEWDWAIQNDKRLLLIQVAPCLIPHRYVSINFINATGPDTAPALAALVCSLGVDSSTVADVLPKEVAPIPIRHASSIQRPASHVPPFIAGREREQTLLRTELDSLLVGRGSLVLIGGEAGIGKTTLTSWLAAEADARGAVVLSGGCYDLTTTPPYGPWGEIVRGWPDDRGLPPVPDALRGGEAMARLASQAALFELATDLLATAGAIRPLVVLLEDLHWADQPSLDLLRYLARLVAGFRIMLVATYRDDEITRRHPLYQLLPSLARESAAERITLQRLDPDATRDLIANRYAIVDDERERLAGYVQRVTEGNPFFAGEVLRALEESGAIARDDGGWRVGDLERLAVPDLVRQVIEGRLSRLGEDAHRLLQIATVIGHEVPVDLWIEVSGEEEGLLSATFDLASEARIVEELPRGDGFRFTHALIRETLYEGLGLLRRRALHRQTGEAMAAGTRPDPDAVAHHFQQASDVRAFDWLLQAASRAERSYAWLIAAERYEQAAAIVADDPDRRREYGWLLTSVARMVRYTDVPRALRYMEEAAGIGESVGDAWLALWPRLDAGYFRVLLGKMREGVEQTAAAGVEMEAAVRDGRLAGWAPPEHLDVDSKPFLDFMIQAAVERPARAVALPRSLTCLHLQGVGRYREARELAEQLAEVWSPDAEALRKIVIGGQWRNAYADLYLALAHVEYAMGLPERSLRSARVALREYTLIGHHFLIFFSHSRILQTLLAFQTEEIEARRVAADNAIDAFIEARGALGAGELPSIVGASGWNIDGAWAEAYAVLREFLGPPGGPYPVTISSQTPVASLAAICVHQGRRDEALELIRHMLPDGADTQPGDRMFYMALICLDLAVVLALNANDPETARAWLEARDRWQSWSGAVLGQVEGHLGWARYNWQAGDLAAAEEQACAALAKAGDPRQPLGLLASHRLLGEMATERGNHEDARDHLTEALALADACAAPFERALSLLALAELDIVRADTEAARTKLAEVRAICEPLEARPTLERVAALEARLS